MHSGAPPFANSSRGPHFFDVARDQASIVFRTYFAFEYLFGQAHALLSAIIGNDATPSFDLIIYQRETGVGLTSMV